MGRTVTLEQVQALAAQLPPQEQLKLIADISGRLSVLHAEGPVPDQETLGRERSARAQAVLALCDAAAKRFPGESDVVADIRRMREER
jgi:hypothetical protein